MGELRRDPIIGQWVVVATDQESLTPAAYAQSPQERIGGTVCQLCPGREKYTPFEVDAIRFDQSAPNSPGWAARAVPNKFPALKIEGDLNKRGLGMYDVSNGIGAHEVIIDTPDHNRDLADLSAQEVSYVLRLYLNRGNALAKDKRFKYIMVFKNYGESAGASVEHAHSQIIALPMVPKLVATELEGTRQYVKYRGRCLFCDILEQEYGDEERIIVQNDSFVAFCPFVPRYPFEIWILPKEHESDFFALQEKHMLPLAEILKQALARMEKTLNCAYNFYIHTVPVGFKEKEFYHWHIEIVPQLVGVKGYEWGTGLYLVPTSPKVAAGYLRDAEL
ncbi:MAG TPA: galactose-1-phosphate uridylyltransferase [Candidatus Bathyarchaeia archaeon]|nr:galactose-1-phosphate uridylyltransferase [Candidatus Bathyarchaeia archaeon]